MDPYLLAAVVAVAAVLLLQILRAALELRRGGAGGLGGAGSQVASVGDITAHSLAFHNGVDWTRPTLVSVRGKVYDVTGWPEYGPGKPLQALAGREIARALAKGAADRAATALAAAKAAAEQAAAAASANNNKAPAARPQSALPLPVDAADLVADLAGLKDEQLSRLETAEAEIARRCGGKSSGRVVASRAFTTEEVARHDGSDPALPLLLSIGGTVYDITPGRNFYGPQGVYPFAGREVARAFALLSTELSDCRDDLEGLSYLELENLREWTAKFDYKYRVLGYVGGTRGDPAVAAEKKRAAAAAAAAGGGKAAAAALAGKGVVAKA
jgi:membrane-associated progesterone receptor component